MTEVYHITSREAWAAAQATGNYAPPSLEAEGFIHCARRDQLTRVANALFRAREDLIVLEICSSKLKVLVKDDCTESGEVFPHVYGPVHLDAVSRIIDLDCDSDGTFTLPEALNHEHPRKGQELNADLANIAKGTESHFLDILA